MSDTRVDCLEETTVTLFLDRRLAPERAIQVEGHIDGCDACRRLLSELARGRGPDPHATPTVVDPHGPDSDAPRPLGDRVDRYVLLRVIGSGGMGMVYAAYDPVLDRKVAIKLLRAGTIDPDRRARLIREAQAMAKVSSPNVVAVHDAGVVGDQVYVSMELVAGGTLKSWLRERPRGWRDIVRVFEAAGRGLAAAHENGLVHRDFKPDNVLIDGDRVRVADFGLAAPMANGPDVPATSSLEHSLTITGAVVGTPAYMSPEQLGGDVVDAQGDQFSFCVALYEALYGVRPFAGDTLAELSAEVRAGRVRPAAKAGPAWLRGVVLRGLDVDPKARHPSMSALLARLARSRARPAIAWVAAGVAVLASGALVAWQLVPSGDPTCRGFTERLGGVWDAPRRHALEAAFLATRAGYAAIAIAGTERALDAYTDAWVAMRTEACEATRVRGDQSERVLDLRMQCLDRRRGELAALVDDLLTADAGVVARAMAAAQALDPIADCADVDAVMARVRPPASLMHRAAADQLRTELDAARALRQTGRYREALARTTPLVSRARAIGYDPLTAEALFELGEDQIKMENRRPAVAALDEAARTAYAANDDDTAARAWIALVYAAGATRIDPRGAEQALAMARAALDRLPRNDARRVKLLSYEGSLRAAEGKDAEARDRHAEALALADRVLARGDDGLATLRNNLALDDANLGDYAAAEKLYREAIALREASLGRDHPDSAETRGNFATLLARQSKHAEALAEFDLAIASLERSVGADHPDVGIYLVNSCESLQSLGRLDDAIARARRALAIFEKLGADDPRTTAALTLVAKLTALNGDGDAAIAMFERALALQEKRLGADHPALATTLNNLAEAQAGRKDHAAAIASYERALKIVEARLGPTHFRVTYSLVGLGESYAATGNDAKAIADLRRAIAVLDKPPGDPGGLAAARFALAGALAHSHGDLREARTLAEQARTYYEGSGERDKAGEAARWLANHR